MNHASIGQQGGRPFRTCIPRIHVEPDSIDTDVRTRVLFEELLLRPPGGIEASGSCGREEKDDSHLAPIAIEVRTECRDPPQIVQSTGHDSGGSRLAERWRRGQCQPRRRDDCSCSTTPDNAEASHGADHARRSCHHLAGFLGTACVETFGQGALIAVTHKFPKKWLPLLAAD